MTSMLPPDQFNQITATRYGPMIYNRHDLYIGRSLEVYGEWCEYECELFRQIVRPGDLALDVGANIGAHTLPLARAVGREGTVLAFEPQRILYQVLCGNLALNSITNVHALMVAVAEAPGSLVVPPLDYEKEDNYGALRLGKPYAVGETVDVITIDQLGLPACRFIKVDVEEMEASVLRGAKATLEAHRPILYVENNPGPLMEPLIRTIDELGYRMYWHITSYNHKRPFKQAEPIFPESLYSYNMVCVHKAMGGDIQGLKPVEVPALS